MRSTLLVILAVVGCPLILADHLTLSADCNSVVCHYSDAKWTTDDGDSFPVKDVGDGCRSKFPVPGMNRLCFDREYAPRHTAFFRFDGQKKVRCLQKEDKKKGGKEEEEKKCNGGHRCREETWVEDKCPWEQKKKKNGTGRIQFPKRPAPVKI